MIDLIEQYKHPIIMGILGFSAIATFMGELPVLEANTKNAIWIASILGVIVYYLVYVKEEQEYSTPSTQYSQPPRQTPFQRPQFPKEAPKEWSPTTDAVHRTAAQVLVNGKPLKKIEEKEEPELTEETEELVEKGKVISTKELKKKEKTAFEKFDEVKKSG